MIIKKRDSKDSDINELTSLLSLNLPENKKFLIERELRFVKSGDRGEKDSAYYIDFIYSSSSKMVSSETLFTVARKLAKSHRPAHIDYKAKFGIEESHNPEINKSEKQKVKSYYCSKCKKAITEKVAIFCWDNKKRFSGRAYCFDCQKSI